MMYFPFLDEERFLAQKHRVVNMISIHILFVYICMTHMIPWSWSAI